MICVVKEPVVDIQDCKKKIKTKNSLHGNISFMMLSPSTIEWQ